MQRSGLGEFLGMMDFPCVVKDCAELRNIGVARDAKGLKLI